MCGSLHVLTFVGIAARHYFHTLLWVTKITGPPHGAKSENVVGAVSVRNGCMCSEDCSDVVEAAG